MSEHALNIRSGSNVNRSVGCPWGGITYSVISYPYQHRQIANEKQDMHGWMYVCMCVCMYVCNVCMYVCMSVYVCTYVGRYVCMYVHYNYRQPYSKGLIVNK